MWMKTIQQDLKFNNLSSNEAIDVADVYVWHYTLLVVHAVKEQQV